MCLVVAGPNSTADAGGLNEARAQLPPEQLPWQVGAFCLKKSRPPACCLECSGRYTDVTLRDVWRSRKAAQLPWGQVGSQASDTSEAAQWAVVIAARCAFCRDGWKLVGSLQPVQALQPVLSQ